MASNTESLNNLLYIQKQNVDRNIKNIWKELSVDTASEQDVINWFKPLTGARRLIESLCRVVGISFHLRNRKLSDEYIIKSVNDGKNIHSFNLVKFATGVQLNIKIKDVENDRIRSTVFCPFVEKGGGWFSENLGDPTHESSESPEVTNPEHYRMFCEVCEQLTKVFEKLSNEFAEDSYFSTLLDNIRVISDKVEKLQASSWPETSALIDICKSIPLDSNAVRYVAFAPERFASEEDMLLFSRINWHMVFDPNQNNEDNKLLLYVKSVMGESPIQLMTDKATLHMSADKINWFFPFGERVRSNNIRSFTKQLRNKIKGQNDNTYIIIDFNDSFKKGMSAKMFDSFVSGVFDEIYNSTGDTEPAFNSNCRLITLKNNSDDDNKLNDFITDASEEDDNELDLERIKYLDFDASKFLNAAAAAGLLHSTIIASDKGLPFLTEEIIRDCNSAGISFLLPDNELPSPTKDFVCGHKIHYSELSLQRDVVRNRKEYDRFKKSICSAEYGKTFFICHEHGAGGTTLSRRLAFDLTDGGKSLERIVVFLGDFASPSDTRTKLHRLSERINNKPIIMISEQDSVDVSKYDGLKTILDSSKYFVHVRVIHSDRPRTSGSIFLKSELDKEERNLFLEKYEGLFLNKERNFADIKRINEISSRLRDMDKVEVVDFPYSFTESFIQQEGLAKETIVPERGKYVSSEIEKLSESIKDYVKFVAFSYYFTNQGVTASMLKNIWSDDGKKLTFKTAFSSKDRIHIYNLLKEEPGESKNDETIWTPRYSAFALEILISICGIEENWPLSELSEQFLRILPSGTPVPQLKTLLDSMYIQQSKNCFKLNSDAYDNSDDRDKRKKLSDRFSILIGRAYNSSGKSTSEQIFDSLIKKYRHEWHYYAHKGRLLFESASFENQLHNSKMYEDAESCISSAEEGLAANEDSDYEVVVHVHGMLWLRRLQSLRNNNLVDVSDILIAEYVANGEKYFKESIALNVTSPYGYMSLGTLYKDAILLGASIRSSDQRLLKDYDSSLKDFCDKKSLYTEYVIGLDDAVEALSSFNFDEEEPEYKGYERLRRNLSAIHGHTKEDIRKYEVKFYNSIDSSNATRIYYGRALINCRKNYSWENIYKGNDTKPTRTDKSIYTNMLPADIIALKKDLETLIALGDLDAYHSLFLLNRYTEKYKFIDSIEALTLWRKAAFAAEESGGIAAKRSILWSNYYLGVAYSAILINSETPDTKMQKDMNECFQNTRKYGNQLCAGLYRRKDVLGKDHKYTWDSIIPYYEAYQDPRGQKPEKSCIRKDAEIIDVQFPNARVGQLEGLSFRGELFGPDDIGKTIKDSIVNFTLGGPGLYNFDGKRLWTLADNVDTSIEEISITDSVLSEPDANVSDSENRINLKIVGKIDMEDTKVVKGEQWQNKQDRCNSEEYIEAKTGTIYKGVLKDGENGIVYPNQNLLNAKRPNQRLSYICIDKSVSKDLKEAWEDEDKVSFQVKYDGDKVYAIKLQRED